MKKTTIWSIVIILASLITATAFIAALGWDMRLARQYYVPASGFPIGDLQPWSFLYHFGEWPAFLMGGAGLLVWLGGFGWRRLQRFRRVGLFLALLLIIGPGILANTIFKDNWGRPRPRQLLEMGGTFSFYQPWQPGPAPKNASFPAGHPTVAFYMSAPYFFLREKERCKALFWLWGGLLYGMFMGLARIIQGGHFLSDVVWSAGFVYISAIILADLLKLETSDP